MNQSQISLRRSAKPAYREPYFWLVVLFPATAVIAGFITLALALRSEDGLVTDDYYRRGLEINRDLARDRAAAQHGLNADLQASTDNSTLTITLHSAEGFQTPERLSVLLAHPTQAGLDKRLTLARTGQQTYAGRLPQLPQGRWYVQIEADDWRLMQTWHLR